MRRTACERAMACRRRCWRPRRGKAFAWSSASTPAYAILPPRRPPPGWASISSLPIIICRHSGLPNALVILNPNQPGCGYACKHLCGAGVAFKLAQALLEAWDVDRARSKILPSFLKMLAIATVADAVPLLGENRVFASVGLEQLRRPASAGLRSLMQVAKLDPAQRALTATDLAFRIAPRINAAGRMDVASDVVELFTTRDAARAGELAAKLDRLNSERQQAEAGMLEQIDRRLREEPAFAVEPLHRDRRRQAGIAASLASWPREWSTVCGVRRSSIALEGGEAYGSGRSVPGFHLLQAIEGCKELFTRFGGHAHAVGFCLPAERLAELKSHLEAWAALNVEEAAPSLRCHAVLPLDQITQALFSWLRRLEPLGNGNEEPVFVAYNVRLTAPVRRHQGSPRMPATRPGGARRQLVCPGVGLGRARPGARPGAGLRHPPCLQAAGEPASGIRRPGTRDRGPGPGQ